MARRARRTGDRPLRGLLVAGWLVGVPVPFMLAWGPSWGWVIAANLLLGVNQGLTWSMTVNMKIDLIGPGRRGFALGINETAGYLGVAVTALVTGYLASWFGLRPAPELLGAGYVVGGLVLSALAVRDTAAWARAEARQHHQQAGPHPPFREIARRVSWTDRTLASVSQAGLVNNLNDGRVWVGVPVQVQGPALRPVHAVSHHFPSQTVPVEVLVLQLHPRAGRRLGVEPYLDLAGLSLISLDRPPRADIPAEDGQAGQRPGGGGISREHDGWERDGNH